MKEEKFSPEEKWVYQPTTLVGQALSSGIGDQHITALYMFFCVFLFGYSLLGFVLLLWGSFVIVLDFCLLRKNIKFSRYLGEGSGRTWERGRIRSKYT